MNDLDTALRLMVIVARTDEDAVLDSATVACYTTEGAQITLVVATGGPRSTTASSSLGPCQIVCLDHADGELDEDEPDQVSCELVAYIRRVQPHVVITSGPQDGRGEADRLAISQLATATVMRAPDPRYGHTCCSRRPHALETDLFEGLRQPTRNLAVAAC